MKGISALILLSLLPAFGHAALLRYELEFIPWSWPPEYTDLGVYPEGTGHLIADTELNAIVGGELNSAFFQFAWADVAPTPMSLIDTYYDWQIVNGGRAHGLDSISGIEGYCDLVFLLPPEVFDYSSSLDQHTYGEDDIWSELGFPEDGGPAGQWFNDYLGLMMTISSPTIITDQTGAPVPEPGTLILLSAGLAAVGGSRLRRTRV